MSLEKGLKPLCSSLKNAMDEREEKNKESYTRKRMRQPVRDKKKLVREIKKGTMKVRRSIGKGRLCCKGWGCAPRKPDLYTQSPFRFSA